MRLIYEQEFSETGGWVHLNRKDPLMFHAAFRNNTDDLIYAINDEYHSQFLNARNGKGCSPLRLAATSGQYEATEFLLDHGAWIDIVDCRWQTPLAIAVKHHKKDVVQLLLSRGAMVDGHPMSECTPLYAACYENDIELVQILIDHGAMLDRSSIIPGYQTSTPLYVTLNYRRLNMFRCLMLAGADPDYTATKLRLIVKQARGFSSLYFTCIEKNLEVQYAELLYEMGANLYHRDYKGRVCIDDEIQERYNKRPTYSATKEYLKSVYYKVRSLQSVCRITIRKALGHRNMRHIASLPLPNRLLDYLVFKDMEMIEEKEERHWWSYNDRRNMPEERKETRSRQEEEDEDNNTLTFGGRTLRATRPQKRSLVNNARTSSFLDLPRDIPESRTSQTSSQNRNDKPDGAKEQNTKKSIFEPGPYFNVFEQLQDGTYRIRNYRSDMSILFPKGARVSEVIYWEDPDAEPNENSGSVAASTSNVEVEEVRVTEQNSSQDGSASELSEAKCSAHACSFDDQPQMQDDSTASVLCTKRQQEKAVEGSHVSKRFKQLSIEENKNDVEIDADPSSLSDVTSIKVDPRSEDEYICDNEEKRSATLNDGTSSLNNPSNKMEEMDESHAALKVSDQELNIKTREEAEGTSSELDSDSSKEIEMRDLELGLESSKEIEMKDIELVLESSKIEPSDTESGCPSSVLQITDIELSSSKRKQTRDGKLDANTGKIGVSDRALNTDSTEAEEKNDKQMSTMKTKSEHIVKDVENSSGTKTAAPPRHQRFNIFEKKEDGTYRIINYRSDMSILYPRGCTSEPEKIPWVDPDEQLDNDNEGQVHCASSISNENDESKAFRFNKIDEKSASNEPTCKDDNAVKTQDESKNESTHGHCPNPVKKKQKQKFNVFELKEDGKYRIKNFRKDIKITYPKGVKINEILHWKGELDDYEDYEDCDSESSANLMPEKEELKECKEAKMDQTSQNDGISHQFSNNNMETKAETTHNSSKANEISNQISSMETQPGATSDSSKDISQVNEPVLNIPNKTPPRPKRFTPMEEIGMGWHTVTFDPNASMMLPKPRRIEEVRGKDWQKDLEDYMVQFGRPPIGLRIPRRRKGEGSAEKQRYHEELERQKREMNPIEENENTESSMDSEEKDDAKAENEAPDSSGALNTCVEKDENTESTIDSAEKYDHKLENEAPGTSGVLNACGGKDENTESTIDSAGKDDTKVENETPNSGEVLTDTALNESVEKGNGGDLRAITRRDGGCYETIQSNPEKKDKIEVKKKDDEDENCIIEYCAYGRGIVNPSMTILVMKKKRPLYETPADHEKDHDDKEIDKMHDRELSHRLDRGDFVQCMVPMFPGSFHTDWPKYPMGGSSICDPEMRARYIKYRDERRRRILDSDLGAVGGSEEL